MSGTQIRAVMFDHNHVMVKLNTEKIFSFLRKNRGNCLEPRELFIGPHTPGADYDFNRINDFEFFERVNQALNANLNFYDFFKLFGDIFQPDWEMIKIRDSLKARGLFTILISNMNDFHFRYINAHFPQLMMGFSYKMISCVEKIAKPDPEMWVRPIDFFGLKAEECLFIDDTWENIAAAAKLGIKTWYYDVRDQDFSPNGRVEEERKKLQNFLRILDDRGLLYKKSF